MLTSQEFLIYAVVFVAAIFATFSTFGFTAMILFPLSQILPLPQAIAISGIIDMTNGFARGFFFRSKIDWKMVLLYGVPSVICSLLGSLWVVNINKVLLESILGVVLIIYGVSKLVFHQQGFPISKGLLIMGGSITGFLAGLIGAGGALRSAFLSSSKLPIAQFIATTTLIEIMVDLVRATGYIASIQLTGDLWKLVFISIPISFVGVWIATPFAKHVHEKTFRNIISLALILFGVMYIAQIV